MYDVAIIGTGPAGLSAALTLKLHNKEIIWFGSKEMSQKVEKSEIVANFPGLTKISGKDLNQHFKDQAEDAGLEITDKIVTSIMPNKKGFMILGDNDVFQAKSVILATGATTGKPYEGEQEYLGRGVSYCATCDGFLYKGKTLAVVCGSERFEHEVEYLAEIAEEVFVLPLYPGCSIKAENAKVLKAAVKRIDGEGGKVNSVLLTEGSELKVDGCFILRPSVAPATLLPGLELDGAHIVADRGAATNVTGCFAAGDCTGRPYQLTKATGEGNVAAHAVLDYLAGLEG